MLIEKVIVHFLEGLKLGGRELADINKEGTVLFTHEETLEALEVSGEVLIALEILIKLVNERDSFYFGT